MVSLPPHKLKKHSPENQELRWRAFDLYDEGWTSEEVAELLGIKKMTVAGWLSWRTRGHYVSESAERRKHEVANLHIVR